MDNISTTKSSPQTSETSARQSDSQTTLLDSDEELNQVYKRISRVQEVRRRSLEILADTECRPLPSRTNTFQISVETIREGAEGDLASSDPNDVDSDYDGPSHLRTPSPRPISTTERPAVPSRNELRPKTEDLLKWKASLAHDLLPADSGPTFRHSYDPSSKRNSWYEEKRTQKSSGLHTPPLPQDADRFSKFQEARMALQKAMNSTDRNSLSQSHRPSLPRKRMVGSNHHDSSQSVNCGVITRDTCASKDGSVDQNVGCRHSNSIDRDANSMTPETPDLDINGYVPSRLEILGARRRDTSTLGRRGEVTYPEATELHAIQQDIAERTLKAERQAQKQGWKGKYRSMTERVSRVKMFLQRRN